jgi:flagellar biosynthesis/type III secretory pathway protein FliH
MSALKLASFDFAPDQASERKTSAAQVMAARQEGFEDGFRQGAEASAREHAERQDQLRAQMVEALLDIHHIQAELGARQLASMNQVLQRIVGTMLPPLAASALLPGVANLLREAFDSAPSAQLVLRCAPDTLPALQALAATTQGRVAFRPDPRLTPLEIRLEWDDGFDGLNLDRLAYEIVAAVERFSELATEVLMPEDAPATTLPESAQEVRHAG